MAAPGNTKQTSANLQIMISKQPHPELLSAARLGDWERLELLLGKLQDEDVVIGIEKPVVVDVEVSTAVTRAEGVTVARDSVLHVVASRGDGDEFLRSATVICGKASHLLGAQNIHGDTPLHRAARAGCRKMVTHLVALASTGSQDHGDDEVKVRLILRMQNQQGETVLHEAIRLGDKDMVGRLMSEDPQLARVRPPDGASPLYLAVWLEYDNIARLLHEKDKALSYSGPDGRNALHVAVLRGQETTKMLLEMNKDLIKQADRSTRSTPLHFAASWGQDEVMSLLLAANQSAAYKADSEGSFPIHLAAFSNNLKAVSILLDGHDDCAELRDANGRTFLHVAVLQESKYVVTYASRTQGRKFASSVMNMQDKDGNTALHLAVEIGNLWIFVLLMENREVMLNLLNNKGQTPLDLSWNTLPVGIPYLDLQDSSIMICNLLRDAGAKKSTCRGDHFYKKHIAKLDKDKDKEEKKIAESRQTVGVASVLITTVAFTAAFAPPGGYRADDDKNGHGGTPTLAGHFAFNVFMIANTLAFICAGFSITCLVYAGVVSVKIRTRMISLAIAVTLLAGSARSLAAAFVFGMYVVLAPVARATAIASCVITALALLDTVSTITMVANGELMLLKRLGVRAWRRLPRAILWRLVSLFWPYIVIAAVLALSKIKKVH